MVSFLGCSNNIGTTLKDTTTETQYSGEEAKERAEAVVFAAYLLEVVDRDNQVYEKYKDYTFDNGSDWGVKETLKEFGPGLNARMRGYGLEYMRKIFTDVNKPIPEVLK
ncbi:hypothetical protein [Clostridium sp.]|uniref:hypothetical protein n=1 Tax=Clostridium sp. TaxID=1506 RepID=UPI001B43F3BF|nr:hypothetical protein [Clostridium sp.]MBP3915617.1 hypothetical protein [Clostridium sp.]